MVIYSLMIQSIKPDSIELNLSIEEFPNKENDLPIELVKMNKNGMILINWVEKKHRRF